jgi:hypothetical protein
VYYSGNVIVNASAAGLSTVYLTGNSPGSATALTVNSLSDCRGIIIIYSLLGQKLQEMNVQLYKGYNNIDLPSASGQVAEAAILSLFVNGQLAYTQKMIR